jgi:hypothetical protein
MPREPRLKELDQPGMAQIIEYDNAAASGHPDDPVPERPNSRSAVADTKRAAQKATGAMSLSKKIDPETKVAGARPNAAKVSGRSNDVKRGAGSTSADKALDHGSAQADGASGATRVRRSNAEIAEGVTTTARKSPAPRAARTDAATGANLTGEPRGLKKTGGQRQRMPAPGNVASAPKGRLLRGTPAADGQRSIASTGGAKPPKRSGRGGHATAASKSKGSDQGLAE